MGLRLKHQLFAEGLEGVGSQWGGLQAMLYTVG